jgi:hypothetical protein
VLATLAVHLAELVVEALVLREAWYWLLYERGPGPAVVQWCGVLLVARVVLRPADLLDLGDPPLRRATRAVVRCSLLWLLLAAVVFVGAALGWELPA